jgi:hypothetical protein
MMDFADYVWLVLGDKFPVPGWLPPFVGVIRYAGGEWVIERHPTGPLHSPALYTQCLHGYGLGEAEIKKVAAVLYKVKQMERAWTINAIFHFSGWQEVGHGPLVDMEPYLNWANDLRRMAAETLKKDEAGKMVIEKKRLQTSIESWFDGGMK